ncbi:hypothetical protein TrRE_jg4275 [Triparma retinervis]|uniref:CRAL-TRIO domain-containing protein n=1 Tax=Triparma retinervis TaxID=2557542 RepID=A0A9W6ZJR0_9STRA|nr:hypothetical protein TrRE_jg4275 [Triparma retinervis]
MVDALSLPVSALLQKHSSTIASIRTDDTSFSDLFYLRHILEFGEEEAAAEIQSTIAWRNGAGSNVVKRAAEAFAMATADGGWNNSPVLERAPHYEKIKPFITGKQILTTSTRDNDLVYCVRAGKIDDMGLMAEVSVSELEEFFLYAKEINCIVADQRSVQSDRLCRVALANDLSGVSLFNSSPDFRKALSQSSTVAAGVYPSVNRETLLLNLPKLLSALVKLFKPIFPKTVQKKLKFCNGPLKDIDDLAQIAREGPERTKFLDQIHDIIADEY